MPRCSTCDNEFEKLETCQYCKKSFCREDYPAHMARERRHAGLAEDEGKLWRRKRESPDPY